MNLRNFDICAEVEAGVGFIYPVKPWISLEIYIKFYFLNTLTISKQCNFHTCTMKRELF